MINILNLPISTLDTNAKTVGEYLKLLLQTVWVKEESFSGKRAFGNSGWRIPVYESLVIAGVVEGRLDSDQKLITCNYEKADELIVAAIEKLFNENS